LAITDTTTEGTADRDTTGASPAPDFNANGDRYDMETDSKPGEGQYADIDTTDNDVRIIFRDFDGSLDSDGTLEPKDAESDATVVVQLWLSDGSEQVFYFGPA
jgi:hypothetical protein